MKRILIKQGRVIDPAAKRDEITDILIENGQVTKIGAQEASIAVDEIINAVGQWVIPGVVDLCHRPHIKHPHGTTLKHEAKVSVKCGFAALCIPPDGDRITDHPNDLIRIQQEDETVPPSLYSIAALTKGLQGERMADFHALKDAGCIALSQAQAPMQQKALIRSCYEYAASLDLPVIVQPQDEELSKLGCAHEGVVATRLGFPGIPYTAETIALQMHLALIEETGIRAHFNCLSSHQSVDLIRQAKEKGLNVTADVAMHALLLTEMDLLDFNGNCHLYPPLRSQRDQMGLIQGIQEGVIDAICSDHRPLDTMAKLAPFQETIPGLSAIDTFLSLGLYLVEKQKLDLHTLIAAISCQPAQIFGLPEGRIAVGQKANLCVVNPQAYWTVNPNTMFSKGKNTPFLDWELPGKITDGIINGRRI